MYRSLSWTEPAGSNQTEQIGRNDILMTGFEADRRSPGIWDCVLYTALLGLNNDKELANTPMFSDIEVDLYMMLWIPTLTIILLEEKQYLIFSFLYCFRGEERGEIKRCVIIILIVIIIVITTILTTKDESNSLVSG